MAGWVEHSQAKSMALPLRASAIGASQAASASRCFGGYVMPYCSSAPLQSGFVSQSGGRPHLSWSWTAARSLILVELQRVGGVLADDARRWCPGRA